MKQDTLLRQIALLQLIPIEPAYKSTSTLYQTLEEDGFDVSERKIQRDLERLSVAFPIRKDDSEKPYKWSFLDTYESRLPELDNASALAWVLAEDHLKNVLPKIVMDKLGRQFKNAKQVLNAQNTNRYSSWQNKVRAISNGKALKPANVKLEIWQAITDYLLEDKNIKVTYLSRTKEELESFTVQPIGLVVRQAVTYLVAIREDCIDDEDRGIRQLALHRIQTLEESTRPGKDHRFCTLDEYVDSGAFDYPKNNELIDLELIVDKSLAWHLRETPINNEQTISKLDENHFVLKAKTTDDSQTLWWLMGFGSKVEVVKPKHWREKIYKHAQEIVGRGQ
ncbi:helix-turn-helix transcriptional regulator [Hydrogenovibrio thermophilus]|uniref:WYL domain-containing protein n=1 Tax=Hydrogenovibrio thermophilus TaxID=265883 RepID=A0A410H1A8_9GAMM|nr:WYL domain-containing protein [Hydrogenovibrio thermophilus]QAB14611.1 WYL domain-containing protein [Hydrogenovibrio thermophilus]